MSTYILFLIKVYTLRISFPFAPTGHTFHLEGYGGKFEFTHNGFTDITTAELDNEWFNMEVLL